MFKLDIASKLPHHEAMLMNCNYLNTSKNFKLLLYDQIYNVLVVSDLACKDLKRYYLVLTSQNAEKETPQAFLDPSEKQGHGQTAAPPGHKLVDAENHSLVGAETYTHTNQHQGRKTSMVTDEFQEVQCNQV